MSNITIRFDPDNFRYAVDFKEYCDFDRYIWENIDSIDFNVDWSIHFDNEYYQYYPSRLSTVLGDLIYEYEFLKLGNDHTFTMSGYPIINVRKSNSEFEFHDIVENDILYICNSVDVIDEFEISISRILYYIKECGIRILM